MNEVHSDHACPDCGERDSDRLEWNRDEVRVHCLNCGSVYWLEVK